MEGNLYDPLKYEIMHKHAFLSTGRREKDKERKEWLIAGGGGRQRSLKVPVVGKRTA